MTQDEYYKERYPLRVSDFLPWGYDTYCDRNGIVNAECVRKSSFANLGNPYLDEVERRAFFLRDFVMPISTTIAAGVGLGTVFIGGALISGLIIEGIEKTKNLLDGLF